MPTLLIEDLQTLLATLAPAGGVHPILNDADVPVYPFITWLRVTSSLNVSFDGPSDQQNTRVQIDIFSRHLIEAEQVANSVAALMAASAAAGTLPNTPLTSHDSHEFEVRAYRITQDYSIWATN